MKATLFVISMAVGLSLLFSEVPTSGNAHPTSNTVSIDITDEEGVTVNVNKLISGLRTVVIVRSDDNNELYTYTMEEAALFIPIEMGIGKIQITVARGKIGSGKLVVLYRKTITR